MKNFICKHLDKKEVMWQGSSEPNSLVDPWFLCNLLSLLDDGKVGCTSDTTISIHSESNYDKRITLFFDTKLFVIEVSFEKPLAYTQKDYLAFEGFCQRYGFNFEEWLPENEITNKEVN